MAAFNNMHRRHLLRVGAVGLGMGVSGWFNALAKAGENDPKRKRACILLWMNGGPSTIDLWDLKPDHENGGPFKPIKAAPELQIGEHLPEVAKFGDRLAVLRGMSTKEGDHGRATYLMRTGSLPVGGIQFPSMGSLISKELGDPTAELPNAVSIAPQRFFNNDAFGPGFLGPNHAPLMVGDGIFQFDGQPAPDLDKVLKVQNLDRASDVSKEHADARLELLKQMQEDFATARPGSISAAHTAAYQRATKLMQSDAGKVFDLDQEKADVRDKYGRNLFGQGCLLARRLVEKGVPFVEVNLGNWDTHGNNFDMVKGLCGTLDKAWGALMGDLKDRGLLDSTLIVWMGEFGRTPKINQGKGRDHYPNAWSTVLAGGGIKGGQAYGKTSKDGTTVEDGLTTTADLLATACAALGIDHTKPNMSNVGRPIPIAEKGAQVVKQVIA